MGVDEFYAWEVANLPWIMVRLVLPALGVLGVLGGLLSARRYRQGYRDARRDELRNMGFEISDRNG